MNKIKRVLNKRNSRGQSIIELLIAIGLASILIPAIMSGILASRGGKAQETQRTEAVQILKQQQEAVRSAANNDWNNISTNGTYHAVISGNQWVLTPGTTTQNGLTTEVVISDVYRDPSGAIVSLGGTLDPSTRQVDISVSWSTPMNASVDTTNYFTRFVNYNHIETLLNDFNPGATSSGTLDVAITDTDGGEIQLGTGGGNGDWCDPALTVYEENLPKNGVANAISAIEGQISVGTGDNASGVSYANVTVDIDPPPNPTAQEDFDGYKTNDVFNESGFAYLGTDTNSKEIVIINLNDYSDPPTNSKYKEEGYFDAPGNGDGDAVATSGNYGYMISGNNFYVFDLSSKSGSRPQVGSSAVGLSGDGSEIAISGNYAYVSTNGTYQLQIIDISNPASPSVVGNATVVGGAGKDVAVNETGTRAYLATAASSSQDEFFIINTENKSSPTPVSGGTFNTAGMDPTAVGVVTGNRAIIVGTGGTDQYQVLDIALESAPSLCGTLQIGTGVNGLDTVLQSNDLAYSYIITGDSTSELKVIQGGDGTGSNFATTGVYESYVFEAIGEAAWNTFSTITAVPQNTTLEFRVAVKNGIAGKCASVVFDDNDFVGPDGTTSTTFTSAGGQIPFSSTSPGYSNPGQCLKYRAYLDTTDITQTPVIYDVSFNFSP